MSAAREDKPKRNIKRNRIPIEDAKAQARALRIRNQIEWRVAHRNGELMPDMPMSPDRTYANNGWKGWADFCGEYYSRTKDWMSFAEAREWAQNSSITTTAEWHAVSRARKLPENMPANPRKTYMHSGWESWGHFLGISMQQWTLEDCMDVAINFETRNAWKLSGGGSYEAARKNNWLDACCAHMRVTRGKWTLETCAADALGYATRSDWQRGNGAAYNAARKSKWLDRCCAHMGGRSREDRYLSFEEARAWTRNSDLRTSAAFREAGKAGELPEGMPSRPDSVYKGRGWSGWVDFTGG
ncbi:MAG: hypothetical protein CL504_08525 [Actinobacteria bacterium]|nr:hypothetical protein [Actinomycetota bacterium]